VRASRLTLSDLAIADILEQAEWYEGQSGVELGIRWEKAVTASLLRISQNPRAAAPCSFKARDLESLFLG
jgi:plasmid stabilization system protein ParE